MHSGSGRDRSGLDAAVSAAAPLLLTPQPAGKHALLHIIVAASWWRSQCLCVLRPYLHMQVLDLVGEDAAGIAASKGSYHWDKRHRKYVQLQPGEAVRAGKRVKAGTGTPVSLNQHFLHHHAMAGLAPRVSLAYDVTHLLPQHAHVHVLR